MAFLDLFRPKWKHSNPEVRKEGVQKLRDIELLDKISKNDVDESVRKVAIERIIERAKNDGHWEVRKIAISKITDQKFLSKIAKNDGHWKVRIIAISKITDQKVLSEIAKNDRHWQIRALAYEKIGDIKAANDIRSFPTVKIGKQIWMAKNLNVEKFHNGDRIPHVKTDEGWIQAGKYAKPAWCYYDNDAANGRVYGKLYNWYAVNDPRGLAPEGWRIPTDKDWTELIDFLGGEKVAGGKLKETGTLDWQSPNEGATNEVGFTALPGGLRYSNGSFDIVGLAGCWWSATEDDATLAWYRTMGYDDSNVDRGNHDEELGFSVRCVRD